MSPFEASNPPIGGLEAKSVCTIWNVVTALLEEVEVPVEVTLNAENELEVSVLLVVDVPALEAIGDDLDGPSFGESEV